ncbi:MAG: ABC transporter permease [Acetivibrionales bacterium]|jgi:putative spermidine/putrescine transport system permease protein
MSETRRWSKEIFFLLLPALTFVLLVFIFPFFYGLYLSLTVKGAQELTLENYVKFFTDPFERQTIWTTLKISMPVAVLSTILAIPLAYYMRRGLKHEKLVTFFLILPTTLGMVLVAEGMLTFFGPNGWFNQLLVAAGVVKEPLQLTHNYTGVFISLFIQNFPMGFLLLLGYVSGINPTLEKAATTLGANKRQIFWRVMFPLMTPGISIAFCINFTASFSVFSSAIMVGAPSGPTRSLAYAAYNWSYERYNQNFGSTITIVMVAIQLLIIGIVFAWRQKMYRGTSMVGKG